MNERRTFVLISSYLYVQMDNARCIRRAMHSPSGKDLMGGYWRLYNGTPQYMLNVDGSFQVQHRKKKVIISSSFINIRFVGSITAENASILDLEYLACASLSSALAEAFPYEVSYGVRYQGQRPAPAGCHECVFDEHFESHRTTRQAHLCHPVAKQVRIQQRCLFR